MPFGSETPQFEGMGSSDIFMDNKLSNLLNYLVISEFWLYADNSLYIQ